MMEAEPAYITGEVVRKLWSGERQVAPTLDGIRADHVARYRLVAPYASGCSIIDAACGCGYGTAMLADAGALSVTGYDASAEAIDYAREHHQRPYTSFILADLDSPPDVAHGGYDIGVCFETLEHIDNDDGLLAWFSGAIVRGGMLAVSAPSLLIHQHPETHKFHQRHYTPADFHAMLLEHGFVPQTLLSQVGGEGGDELYPDWEHGTLIALCVRL